MKCRTCQFWESEPHQAIRHFGTCRAVPPRGEKWAVTTPDDWCGVYVEAAEEPGAQPPELIVADVFRFDIDESMDHTVWTNRRGTFGDNWPYRIKVVDWRGHVMTVKMPAHVPVARRDELLTALANTVEHRVKITSDVDEEFERFEQGALGRLLLDGRARITEINRDHILVHADFRNTDSDLMLKLEGELIALGKRIAKSA